MKFGQAPKQTNKQTNKQITSGVIEFTDSILCGDNGGTLLCTIALNKLSP